MTAVAWGARRVAAPWRWLAIVAALAMAFGLAYPVWRAAIHRPPRSDLDVFLRAARAARDGEDIYRLTDGHGWHYAYPTLFAILLRPLAGLSTADDAARPTGFAAAALLWYAFSLGCLDWGVRELAGAIEETRVGSWDLPHPPAPSPQTSWRGGEGSVRQLYPWNMNPVLPLSTKSVERGPGGEAGPNFPTHKAWLLHWLPPAVCLAGIFETLNRGQVGLLLLALLYGMIAAALRGRSAAAGLWLAGAICLKVIPAFLLLYPLWRRDRHWLASTAAGLAVGLAIIPALVFGPQRALVYAREYTAVLLRPAVAGGPGGEAREQELLSLARSHSQSLLGVAHTTLFRDPAHRPAQPPAWLRRFCWLLVAALTALTLGAAGRVGARNHRSEALLLGSLVVLMLLASPVCHLHYLCLWLPLVMALAASGGSEKKMTLLFAVAGLASMLPLIFDADLARALGATPYRDRLHDLGVPMYASLLLWFAGCRMLRRERERYRTCSTGVP